MRNKIVFRGASKFEWVRVICDWLPDEIINNESSVEIHFKEIDNQDVFDPFHIVILACYIQYIFDLDYKCCSIKSTDEIGNFWINKVKLPQYWGDQQQTYVESESETIFNLWHAQDTEKETYSDNVHKYLKRKFFQNKDLSAIKNSLLEIYYNIFDHAQANGNNFSYMKYNVQKSRLYVAICDFGKGIAKNIRERFVEIDNDEDALMHATKPRVTTQSQNHNMGMGLGNILDHISDDDTLRIVSNGAVLVRAGGKTKTFPLENNFQGTLIFYDISLNNFDNDENYSIFDLNFDL